MGRLLKILRQRFRESFSLPKISANPPYARFFLVVFVYAAASAVFVQFIALPHMFSSWHAGNGLLSGMDSVGYHAQAVELARRIRAEGWPVWELAPEEHFTVGFSAAIYALTVSKPWVVIPFNAAAHALSAVVLLRLFLLICPNWRWSAMAAAPFVFFPSAMIWYTQLLKDGYFFTGALLFIYGWMILAHRATWEGGWRAPSCAVAWILLGFVIMGLIRAFSLSLMSLVAAPMLSILLVSLGAHAIRRELPVQRAIIAATVAGACFAVLLGVKEYTVVSGMASSMAIERTAPRMLIEQWWSKSLVPAQRAVSEQSWIEKLERSMMPFVVVKLVSLANIRYGYVSADPSARSAVDKDTQFQRPVDIAGYLPRAAQVAFLSPFPAQWFGEGKYESTTFMRRISMFEMLIVYATLAFLPLATWRWRGAGEVWILLTCCACILLIYGLAVPNVGTLYRIRYGYLMPLVGLGVLGGLVAWDGVRRRRRSMTTPP